MQNDIYSFTLKVSCYCQSVISSVKIFTARRLHMFVPIFQLFYLSGQEIFIGYLNNNFIIKKPIQFKDFIPDQKIVDIIIVIYPFISHISYFNQILNINPNITPALHFNLNFSLLLQPLLNPPFCIQFSSNFRTKTLRIIVLSSPLV